MKITARIIFTILFITIITSIKGQNRITIPLEPFNTLSVSGKISLELIPSESTEMIITDLNGKPGDVGVENKNGKLSIKIRPSINKENAIKIQLPYKQITLLEAYTGAVINSAVELETESLELKAGSGGKIELHLNVEQILAKVTQVSDIVLYGNAESQNVTVNTGGNYLAYDLICQDTYIKVSSGSQGKVTASRIIEATSYTKGFIGYIGDPVSTYTKTSFGGEVASYKTKPDTEIY